MPPLAIPFPDFEPVLVQVGPVAIRWYGLAYVAGILLGWFCARAIVRSQRLWDGPAPMTPVDIDDFVLWASLGVILGGRIGYVLFYNPAHFVFHPIEIIQPWNGGMSFHGGFAGVVIAVVLFARSRNIPMLSLGDVICAVYPIGHFLGRIANFVNGELWGRPSDVPWAMIFPAAGPLPRHPSQLYEAALEGLLLLIALGLLISSGALKRPGLVIGAFAVGYSLMRCFCELFREPDSQLGFLWGGVTMGMLLSLPLLLAGLSLIWNAFRRPCTRAV
jgi:phosphatidylglycerol---prolipoprotein diacylglyceryl transferase